ncbi:TetR/AcrR family transcriptional regulator [Pseudonocardia endophytica]|uniref:TetR family transcriptional regulator n=1 Tax=Pseudonocardia endophytica TaxID=401976 RepID=A0A4R1I3I9_PSEEN|nr:TetR family transcriptional regulator [Pseudonocardia endophytica]TCK27089.1 TetR family transcriptional regulator [Pseudonocardia endophytica]
MARPTEKGERRRRLLAEAAAGLLAEGGFEAVRHRAVAERAGLPLASTTYYYASLDELVTAAAEVLGRTELDEAMATLDAAGSDDDPREIVLDMLLGPASRTDGLDAVLRHFERLVGAGRRPYLAPLMRAQRAELDALLTTALARAGHHPDPVALRRIVALVDGAVVSALIEADADTRTIARAALADALST